ncbi:MAG: hypothetical protein IPN69_05045 [Acidobacteria bacterium]|nr:hypothetical protein [Acidobacteriota bacterium]MBK8810082.1 hypothetical protein [Acidobacteriota bacterium]
MKIKPIAAVAVVFAVLFMFRTVDAARCAATTFRGSYASANSVFVGKVASEKVVGDARLIEFSVEKYWKGPGTKRLTVSVYETMRFQSWFGIGDRYLIYATNGNDGLVVERCSRTRTFELAADDLKKLGKGKTPRR